MSGDNAEVPLIDIRPDHWAIVQGILQKHVPQCEVWAFGSRAKWTAKPYSDLDLAVIGYQPLPLEVSAALADDFSESDLPWKVDVVDWATTSETFRKIIDRDKVVVQRGQADRWRDVTIEDIAERIAIGPFGSRMTSDCYTDTGVPVIRGTNITGGRSFSGEWVYVSEEKADELKGSNVFAGDLVFPHRGSIGEVGIVPADRNRYLLSSSLMMLRSDKLQAHSLFLYYYFRSAAGKHELLKNASQVGTPGIGQPLSSLRQISLSLPPPNEQRAIGQILGSIDDRIELNRRTNDTLEAMARALFKDWFIDFGPVRAKLEGLPPYLAPEIWSLFPEEGDEDGVPVGWQSGRLSDVASSRSEGVQPASVDESTPYIGLEHMPRCSIALDAWEGAGKVSSNKSIFRKGDILFGKLRPYFHKVGIAPLDGICSTDIVVIRERQAPWASFVRMCVSSSDFVAFTDKSSTGTKMPRTNWPIMGSYSITLPTADVAQAYDHLVHPLIEVIISNTHENKALSAMRDLLLPKLISGELRIPNPKAFLTEVAP
ncbi:MAG: restriction endonuclease subunit S [Aquabacterium sp.]|uniref:restriction endonuclease subunit S n=1 Tax=Aquabacterium sp. TaxID=1872578 RepID=UPI002724930F|nr:restriction endonuclease subunit S [Aquabacterium sp.]MDO9003397.1 restriction endonuclease subunit S [Aquabacterium sp.]